MSSPETSRMGNFFGITGMILAIVVSILSVDIFFSNLIYFIIALSIGGLIGGIHSIQNTNDCYASTCCWLS